MEERDWQIIKTLYEQKNITKTARVLYMSQPTLTARIKQIEESLGTKLLYRGNKGITFTETGEYTVKFAEHILGEMQELRETITNMQEDVAGTLRIAAPSILARYFLPKLLGRFPEQLNAIVSDELFWVCVPPKRNLMYRLHKAVML